jgi:hypothetical protein
VELPLSELNSRLESFPLEPEVILDLLVNHSVDVVEVPLGIEVLLPATEVLYEIFEFLFFALKLLKRHFCLLLLPMHIVLLEHVEDCFVGVFLERIHILAIHCFTLHPPGFHYDLPR